MQVQVEQADRAVFVVDDVAQCGGQFDALDDTSMEEAGGVVVDIQLIVQRGGQKLFWQG